MNRNSIECPRYTVEQVKELLGAPQQAYDLINIRGCNGAGKSTVPLSMMDDEELSLIVWDKNGKTKPFATWFKKQGYIAFGTYMNKTGGLDTYKNNEETKKALTLLWEIPQNLLMEGVIASTIKSTYAELFHEMLTDPNLTVKREVLIASLLPPVEICLARIQKRNGGKAIDEKAVISKWNTVKRNVEYFKEQHLNSIEIDNSTWDIEDTKQNFFDITDEAIMVYSTKEQS
jgi:hypothetical protein